MKLRAALVAGTLAAGVLVPAAAEAAWVTANVNMRTGPGTQFPVITTIPAGSHVNVGRCTSWCSVTFRGRRGYVSANFISGVGRPGPRPPGIHRPPPPRWGYVRKPWWDSRHNAWYDGRRWYFGGQWYNQPGGFHFGVGVGW